MTTDGWFEQGEPVRLSEEAREVTGLVDTTYTVVRVLRPVTRKTLVSCPHCDKPVQLPRHTTHYFLSIKVGGRCCEPFPQHWLWKDHTFEKVGPGEWLRVATI